MPKTFGVNDQGETVILDTNGKIVADMSKSLRTQAEPGKTCQCGNRCPNPVPTDLEGRLYDDPIAAVRHFRDNLPLLAPDEIENDQSRPPALPKEVTQPFYIRQICQILGKKISNKLCDRPSAVELIGD